MRMAPRKGSKRPDAKNYLPKTADGKIKGGPGRGKGTPNKISGQAKENIAAVFDALDGIDGMVTWAKSHKDEFYTNIYTKLIPVHIQGQVNAQVNDGDGRLLASAMVDALARVIAARQGGGEGVGVIIDNVAAEEPIPQLVISSKTGTKAA